jgi:LysM repeat protein
MSMLRQKISLRLARWGMAVLALAALMGGAGCGNGDKIEAVSETDEKQFQYAQQMLKEDRSDEALAAFLRVISKRQDDAPESHIEAGQLLLRQKKDPIAAIYHFQKYLEAQPNSEKAPMVRELIDTAKKEFARSLPGQPGAGDYDNIELLDQIKNLQNENADLRRQLNFAVQDQVTAISLENSAPTPVHPTPINGVNLGSPTPAIVTPAPATVTPAPPAATTHTYTVAAGDTLTAISRKMYGTPNRFLQIYQANQDQLPNPNAMLHPGQILKIPPQ